MTKKNEMEKIIPEGELNAESDNLTNTQETDAEVVNLPVTPDLIANVKVEEPIKIEQDEILVFKVNHAISIGAFKTLCEMAKIEQELTGREIVVVPFSAVLQKEKKE